MIQGAHKLVVEVEDQDRALRFWTQAVGFDVVQDTPYGDERWLEVGTPDGNTTSCSHSGSASRRPAPKSCRPQTSSSI